MPNRQVLALHHFRGPIHAQIDRWLENGTTEKLWKGDPRIWSPKRVPELADRLGWLHLHETMRPRLDEFRKIAEGLRGAGVEQVVLLGMGGSSLAPELFASVFSSERDGMRLMVLDSTHPDAVREIMEEMVSRPTAFIVSSKSGTTQETNAFFHRFWSQIGPSARHRFVAITDPATPLAKLAGERRFTALVEAPSDIGGRFSALSPFGLVPAAVLGLDLDLMLDHAAEMATVCAKPEDINPALQLGATMGVLAVAGIDKITIHTSHTLRALPGWLEQLIAESLGKDGKGVVPVADEPWGPPDLYGTDRWFAQISMAGDHLDLGEARQLHARHPTCLIDLTERYAVVQELLRWELAVALAGSVIGVHPFNQPDVEIAKQLARKALTNPSSERIDEFKVTEPYAMRRGLRGWLNAITPGTYAGIQAYIHRNEQADRYLGAIRRLTMDHKRVATTVGFGPRFLHSTGQLHKGGPDASFLQIVDEPVEDVPIPDSDSTFGQLIAAQSAGDYLALQRVGRNVVRINLGREPVDGLGQLVEALQG